MDSIFEKLEIPEEDKKTAIKKSEGEFIYKFLKKHNIKKTLEIGLAYGGSAAYITSATKSKHHVCDLFQKRDYKNLGLKNLKKLDLFKYINFKEEPSIDFLHKLLKQRTKIDFAFIDGGHRFDEIFIDFYYVDLILNKNGFVLFHDFYLRSTKHVIFWIKNNKKNYKIIKLPLGNLCLVQKIDKDKRPWDHFEEFCISKSFLSCVKCKLFAEKNLLN